jgi:hypothetical protein
VSRGLGRPVLGAGCLNITGPLLASPPGGFAGIARVAKVVALRDYRALGVAGEFSLETFCGEVKHHG